MFTEIHKHVTPLQLDGQQIRDEKLKSILTNVYNDFQKYDFVNNALTSDDGLKAMQFFCKKMIDSEVYKNILRPQIIDHELFSLMGNTMLVILQNINKGTGKDSQSTNLNWEVFCAMAQVLISSLPPHQFEDEKLNKIVRKTFFNEEFLIAIKECIESLLSNDYWNNETKCRILSYVFKHVYSDSKACKELLRSWLLDSTVQCIISKVYIDQFSENDEVSVDFLLIECPNFVLSNFNDHHEDIANLLCQSLLKNYKNVLSYLRNRRHGDSKSNKYLNSYLKLLNHCATIESTRTMFAQYLPFIITELCTTMKECLSLNDETTITYIKDEEILATILTLLYNLASNSTINDVIKEIVPKSILLFLCDNEEKKISSNGTRQKINIPKNIQFPARSLVALSTEDIDDLDQPDEVTNLLVIYLAKAVKNDSQTYEGVHAKIRLFLVAIAQNDQVKEQIVESGALRLLSDCVLTPGAAVYKIQQPALDAMWLVSFNGKARLVLRTDEKLVTRLQEIFKSGSSFDQQKAADGVLWRLINEENFRAQQLTVQRILVHPNEKISKPTYEDDNEWVKINRGGCPVVVLRGNLTKEEREKITAQRSQTLDLQMKTSKPYKYDLMISYCHKNSDLCNIIYNGLLKLEKYKIWIDKKEMHGSMMERMAEAIEDSHLMLVCMSSAYKTSQACQAECEYAFRRQSRALFLKIEPNYKPKGWLGIFLGSRYYIDITKGDFLTKFKEIVKQISIERNETPDYSLIDTIITADVQRAVTDTLKTKDKISCTAATKAISTNIDKMLLSGDIHQSTLSPPSFRKATTCATNSEHKTYNINAPSSPNTKEILNVKPSLLNASNNFIPSSTISTTSDTDLQQINSKQDTPISSSSIVLSFEKSTSLLDSQSKIKEECLTPEKLEKYYPSNFDYGNVDDNQASLNDFSLKIRTSNIPNLSDD
ncbi:unnamed protein product, partial [Rotaria sp. Silwood2]